MTDRHWDPRVEDYGRKSKAYKRMTASEHYIKMRDGTRIAIDVTLPEGLGHKKVPTVIRQTRYFRKFRLGKFWQLIGLQALVDQAYKIRKYFVLRGYAWVDVDVRGSGASEGENRYPWSKEEINDGYEICEWIVHQSWSNGLIASVGTSYEGTTAEFLATTLHPAVKAVAPRFSNFDSFADIAAPGGVKNSDFTKRWGILTLALDSNRPWDATTPISRLIIRGVKPVSGDFDTIKKAIAARGVNYGGIIHQVMEERDFRDDEHEEYPGLRVDHFSPHSFVDKLEQSGVAVYSYSGWYDGAYPHAAIKRFHFIRNRDSRLIIGPWEHGGRFNCSPFQKNKGSMFDHFGELLRFFDQYLRTELNPPQEKDPVHYYTVGEEVWKSSSHWPLKNQKLREFYLDENGGLSAQLGSEAEDIYQIHYGVGTGSLSRWRSLTTPPPFKPVTYKMKEMDRLRRCYQSTPFLEDAEITGHTIVELFLRVDADDGNLFAYLEDIDEDGGVHYITEGLVRLIHKTNPEVYLNLKGLPQRSYNREDAERLEPDGITRVSFDLLPVSYLVKKGSRLRISFAGADKDHFNPTVSKPTTFSFLRGEKYPSKIKVPVIRPT